MHIFIFMANALIDSVVYTARNKVKMNKIPPLGVIVSGQLFGR